MKLETFFEKFDQFADAPDAVAKMRELLIHFAVSGKLVPNDPEEEPVGLKLSGALEGESPLPANWRVGFLGDTFNFEYGDNLPAPKRSQSGEYPVYGSNGIVGTHDTYLTKEPAIIVGRKGSAGALNIATGPSWTTDVAYYVRPPRDIDLRFTYYLFSTLWLDDLGKGIKPGLSRKEAYALRIALPPLAEQKRIVAKVDELMALCDRLEAQQEKRVTRHTALVRASLAHFAEAPTPANLNFLFHPSYTIPPSDLRKSILTLAVQGKLVPQDPNDESAEVLLAGIAADVAKAVRAKQMRNSKPIPPYEDEFPFDLPCGWEWAPLGTLTAAEDGAMCDGPFGSKLKTEHYISTKGYAVLRLGNIGVGYFIHGKEGHISREHFESLSSNHTAPGDLLVAGLADPLVRCCEVPPDIGPAVNKSDCFRVRLNSRMDRSYVRHYLNSPIAKAFAAEENHGMTRERINLGNAKALPVSVPPLAEQRRIVAKVDQLMALVDQLEGHFIASRATAEKLMEAVVAELTT